MFKFNNHKPFVLQIFYIICLITITTLFLLMSINIINFSDKNEYYNNKLSELKIITANNQNYSEITNSFKIENSNYKHDINMFMSGEKETIESLPFSKSDVKDFTNFLIKYNNIGLASSDSVSLNTCLPEIQLWRINQDKSENKIGTANSFDESKVLYSYHYSDYSHNKNFEFYLSKFSFNIVKTPWVYKKLSSNRFIYQKIFNDDISKVSSIKLSSLNNIVQVNLRISLNGFDYIITNAYYSNSKNDFVSSNNIFININSVLSGININSSIGVKLKEIYVFIDDKSEPINLPINTVSFYSDNDNVTKTFLVKINEKNGISKLDFNISNILQDYNDSQLFKFRYVFTNREKLDICKIKNFSNFAYNQQSKKLSKKASDLSYYFNSSDLSSISKDKPNFNVFIPDSIVPLSVFRNKTFDEQIVKAINSKLSIDVSSSSNYGNLNLSFLNGLINNISLELKFYNGIKNKYLYIYNGIRGREDSLSFSSTQGLIGKIKYKTSIPIGLDFIPTETDYLNINFPINDIDIILNEGFYSIGFLDSIQYDISTYPKFGLPYYVKYFPKIILSSGSDVRIIDNSISASLNSFPLKFSIDVSKDLIWINDFTFKYNFSNLSYLKSCPINLDIVFESGNSIQKKYCINTYIGIIKTNMSEFALLKNSYGPISKFNWSIEKSGPSTTTTYAKFLVEFNGGILHSDNLSNFFEKFEHLNLESGSNISPSSLNRFVSTVEPNFKFFNNNFLNLSILLSFISIFLININAYKNLLYLTKFIFIYKFIIYYVVLYNLINIIISLSTDSYYQLQIIDYLYIFIFLLIIFYSFINEFTKKINYPFLFSIILTFIFLFIFSNDLFMDKSPFSFLTILLVLLISFTRHFSHFYKIYFNDSLLNKTIVSSILFSFALFISILFSPPILSNLLISFTFISITVLIFALTKLLSPKFILFNSSYLSTIIYLILSICLFKILNFNILLFYFLNILFFSLIYFLFHVTFSRSK